MATTYDKASLVMIPSGYKDDKLYSIKPTDGSGDFTFSRDGAGASPATRVNASGLIEKGRTNELLQSNTFSTTWLTNFISLSGGQSGYDGSSDAWEMTDTRATGNGTWIYQNISRTGVLNFSFYAKAGTQSFLRCLIIGTGGATLWVDLSNGTISNQTDVIASSATSVGGGWYRISFSGNVTASAVRIQMADAAGSSSSTLGATTYIQDAQLESGLVATDYIETTTAPVSAGLLGDMPRLDYSGGATCPSLLLEPSRVNLITQSEYIGAWSTFGGIETITDNYAISPEGIQNAARVELERSPTLSRIQLSASGTTNGVSCVFSVYLKANSGSPAVYLQAGPNVGTAIELTNEWQRYDLLGTASGSNTTCIIGISDSVSGTTETADILVYGAQLESSASYVSSYIPTYGSASTRGADVCNDTTATDVIGQTEGSIFVDFVFDGLSNTNGAVFLLLTANGGGSNRVQISLGSVRDIVALVLNGGVSVGQANTSSSYLVDGTRYKVGVSYSVSGGLVLYINGTLIDTDTLASVPSRDRIHINDFLTSGSYVGALDMKQTLLFKTALSNAELAALTTI